MSIEDLIAVRHESTPIVFVVHEDASVRLTMDWISRAAGFELKTCAGAAEFFGRRRAHAPGCLILDAALWDMHRVELHRFLSDGSETPVVFIAERGDVPMAVRAMKAGAVEFLMNPIDEHALFIAVQAAIDRSQAAITRGGELRMLGERYATLTLRERQVMVRVLCGQLNKHVAEQLGISVVTVKVHRHRAMQKMRATSFAELVRMGSTLQLPNCFFHAPHRSSIIGSDLVDLRIDDDSWQGSHPTLQTATTSWRVDGPPPRWSRAPDLAGSTARIQSKRQYAP
jgi:FixJ family two-component response regulator